MTARCVHFMPADSRGYRHWIHFPVDGIRKDGLVMDRLVVVIRGMEIERRRLSCQSTTERGRHPPRFRRSVWTASERELAPIFPSAKLTSAKVWIVAEFPVPASPFSQNTRWSLSSFTQCSSCRRTSARVPLRHPCLFPEEYPASLV